MEVAATRGNLYMVKYLFNLGHKLITNHDNTPLHNAAREGHCHIIKFLLENGMPVNHQDFYNNTALHYACWNGHLDAVKLLLFNGAWVNQNDQDGNTALHLAYKSGNMQIVDILIYNGANPYFKNYNNMVPKDYFQRKEH